MPTSHKKTLRELCEGEVGYVLETGEPIRDKSTIKEATYQVKVKINKLMLDIKKGSRREVVKFYIGKSYIHKRKGRPFDPGEHSTWTLDHGVNGCYSVHVDEDYGKDGLLVVAVVTAESIPTDCKEKGYITHQEEYALTLEKRLIQRYKDDEEWRDKLENKTADAGKTDGGKSIGYVIYIAIKLAASKSPFSMLPSG